MELRVLRYFLMAAREENITRAARLLHISQPTLSRQLMQLEEELGAQLFHRGRHSIVLTDDGMLLRRRAQEILDLAEKTSQELSHREEDLAGEVSIGCGETRNMTVLSQAIASFRRSHPYVQFSIYSATADDTKERMERGLLDLGLLMEPVDISRYEFLRMPRRERWAALVREDSPLAAQSCVTPAELSRLPLIMARRESVQTELAGWFGLPAEHLEVAATYNLVLNAVSMVRCGVGVALCYVLDDGYAGVRTVPLSPTLESGAVLAYKKGQALSRPSRAFVAHIKQCLLSISHNEA